MSKAEKDRERIVGKRGIRWDTATHTSHQNKGGDRTKKLIPIGTIILIAGVPICLGTFVWFDLPMMPVLGSIILALGLTFLVLYTLYREKTNILSLAMIIIGIVITILTTYVYNTERQYWGGITKTYTTLLIGIAVILIGLAGLINTRRKEVIE